MSSESNFWLLNIKTLFNSIQVVPTNLMPIGEQLNSVTRLILIIFLIMILFNYTHSIHFVLISISIIILIYYIKSVKMKKVQIRENFGASPGIASGNPQTYKDNKPLNFNTLSNEKIVLQNGVPYRKSYIQTPENLAFCNDGVSIDSPNNIAVSMNQNLAGKAGQLTRISPIVVPPTHELSYWRDNNLIVHSAVNKTGIEENMYLSGYAESECCGYLNQGSELIPKCDNKESYKYSSGGIVAPVPTEDVSFVPTLPVYRGQENYTRRVGIAAPVPTEDVSFVPTLPQERISLPNNSRVPTKEKYCGYFNAGEEVVANRPYIENYTNIRNNQPGWLNTECGYDPDQLLQAGIPSNLPAGNCEKNPNMKQYNENLFTSTITPGVYTRTEVNEPINSNIGISFQQQFEPTTSYRDENGLHYIQHDPRLYTPPMKEHENPANEKATYDNVYDPRFYGYGTSYRSYIEPTTGQPRFMYDDINAIRHPNYITRSKIDFLPYADTYGTLPEGGEYGNVHNPHIKELVQDSWMRNSLQFRDDLTERQMRKINANMWQRRQAPFGANMN